MDKNYKSVKVNCSFCNGEMECPENMLEASEKHMCFECFKKQDETGFIGDTSKVHIDIPKDKAMGMIPDSMASSLVEELFPEIWAEKKEELKEMSKKELAQ